MFTPGLETDSWGFDERFVALCPKDAGEGHLKSGCIVLCYYAVHGSNWLGAEAAIGVVRVGRIGTSKYIFSRGQITPAKMGREVLAIS